MKRIVTKEDLDLNPELVEQGVEVGHEIDIPEKEEEDGKTEDGPGPGAPPPPPPPPIKP